MSGKVTRETLTTLIAQEMGITTASAARQFVDVAIACMVAGIVHDEELVLTNFGRFKVHAKKDRPGRNPRTGEGVVIKSRKSVAFKPARRVQLSP